MRYTNRSKSWPLFALTALLAAPLGAHAEAPHSTTVGPGGSSATEASQNTTVNGAETYSAMEPESGGAPAVEVDNQPPRFLYSSGPAILIPVDGEPVLHDSGAADLDRVLNSRAPLFKSRRDNRFHVQVGNQWYAAKSVNGDWASETPSSALLNRLEDAKKKAGNEIETITPPASGARVFASTEPAELIQTTGNASITPITGALSYVSNTPNDLFYQSSDQHYYVLASGRWYRSTSLNGVWNYVDARTLPAEFAQIPAGHPKASVLASVPGTAPAQTAVANAAVPQVATVDRSATANSVRYDGAPDFVPIPGTALTYARNSNEPVIEVSPGRFMLVENGVWFEAPTSQGPWSVAASVPPAIYTIPPSSPVYYVSYVYVYGSGPGWVRVGYLPGYTGSYVTSEGVVVYGTGYHYRPWIGNVWYGYPVTYGFGVSWGLGGGWVFGGPVYHPYHPYWGPWRYGYYHHYSSGPVYVTRHDFYRDWSHHVTPEHFASHTPPARPYDSRPSWSHAGTPSGNTHSPGGWTHTGTPSGATHTPGGWTHSGTPSGATHTPGGWAHSGTPNAGPHTPGGWSHSGTPGANPTPSSPRAPSGGWSHYTAPAPTHSAPPGFNRTEIPRTASPAPYHGTSPSPFGQPHSYSHAPTPSPVPQRYTSSAPGGNHSFNPSREFHPPSSSHADLHGAFSHTNAEHAHR
jgi:hypothetical protein